MCVNQYSALVSKGTSNNYGAIPLWDHAIQTVLTCHIGHSFIVPCSSTDCLYKLLIPKARETGTAAGDNNTNLLLYSNLRSTGKDLLIKADDY